MFYDFLVDNEAQQGASLRTLKGLLASAENATLLLLNGDVSYARSVLSKLRRSRSPCPKHRSPCLKALPQIHMVDVRCLMLQVYPAQVTSEMHLSSS